MLDRVSACTITTGVSAGLAVGSGVGEGVRVGVGVGSGVGIGVGGMNGCDTLTVVSLELVVEAEIRTIDSEIVSTAKTATIILSAKLPYFFLLPAMSRPSIFLVSMYVHNFRNDLRLCLRL